MQHLLEEKFLPYVIKPGRYIGGELGQVKKDPSGRVTVALGYPDMYEIGMSYLGLQLLYNIINADDRFLCERFFAPDRDAEKLMRTEKIPVFTLESARSLKEFDVVGFTLAYEMVFTNLLNILDLAGIPLHSDDRGDDDPLIIAGGPAAHNPEPTAEFIDMYYLGDAEENIIRMLEIIRETRGRSRVERLEHLVREVPGLYVPQFYDEHSGEPKTSFAPAEIKSVKIKSLSCDFYPGQTMVPFIETIHDRLTVEIMRGCPRACRFCQATAVYRPVRLRPVNDIVGQIREQLQQTGFDEVSLLSLSSSDYPDIIPLTVQLARELQARQVALSLPSLRPGTFTQELADAVKTSRKTGLTFAPEAGSERLRAVIRKDITDQQLYDTIELVFRNGWNHVKLYFMIGLPTETDEDIDGIVTMIRRVNRIARGAKGKNNINVTISPFSPKPHTPFQWDPQPSPDYIREKGQYIRRRAGNAFVNIKLRNPHLSLLEGILGRGGREFGPVIERAFRKGARFDGWSEMFEPDRWLEAFAECGLDPYAYLQGRSFSEKLPWSKIRLHVSAERLVQERNRTSTILKDKPKETDIPLSTGADNASSAFGRGRKRVQTRSLVGPSTGNVRIKWGRRGPVRFLSHRDNMRLFERALRRAELPVAFSQGFHPHMKLSFGPPLTLGFTSEAEYFDLTLERPFSPDMASRLEAALPEGYFMVSARPIISTKISLTSRLNLAAYRVRLPGRSDTAEKLDQLLARTTVEIERTSKDRIKTIDIRPAIVRVEIADDPESGDMALINMDLGLGSAGYARPTEVIAAAGLAADNIIPSLVFDRREMYAVDNDGRRLTPMEF